MISSKKELREYLKADKESLGIQRKRPKLFRDEIWRFEIALRKYSCCSSVKNDNLQW